MKAIVAYSILLLVVGSVGFVIYYIAELLNSNLRLTRTEGRLDVYKGLTMVSPIVCSSATKNYKVCDYYMAGSARSIYPSKNVFDYVSETTLGKVLGTGCRWIELDIYDSGANSAVVALQHRNTGFQYSYNNVAIDDALHNILNAWNSSITMNTTDPMFVSFNFHTENTVVLNAVANSIKNILGDHLLGLSYSYTKANIAQESLCNLTNKLVIVSSGKTCSGTDMEELINMSWDTGGSLRRLNFTEAQETYSMKELTDYNRQNITMVVPDTNSQNTNRDPSALWTYGCQVIMMNYADVNDAMATYLEKFQKSAFVLKPESLRYEQPTYPAPKLQQPAKYFTPMQVKNPLYTATI